jgi:hypothetical protein
VPKLLTADYAALVLGEGAQCFCVEFSPDVGSISTQKLHGAHPGR